MPHINIEICDRQKLLKFDPVRLREAIRQVLLGERVRAADVSVAVVDNAEIHAVNLRYLQHDWPTDVLSFLLGGDADALEAELILSAEMARERAPEFGWPWQSELLLYAIHGTLHLAGHGDHGTAARVAMQRREQYYLELLNIQPPRGSAPVSSLSRASGVTADDTEGPSL